MFAEATKIGEISARWPEPMDGKTFTIPILLPSCFTRFFWAKFLGPGQCERIIVVIDFFTGWIARWVRGSCETARQSNKDDKRNFDIILLLY